MARIALFGRGLLPFQPGSLHSAHGLRTWQFALALARGGHEVHGLIVDCEVDEDGPSLPDHAPERIVFRRISAKRTREPEAIREILGAIAPDAVVGATTLGSYVAATGEPPVPMWLDLHGDPMAEGQAAARSEGDYKSFELYLWALATCLGRGDRFSVVSQAQQWALLGQLGLFGRLNADTAGEDLVAAIPDAFESELELVALPGAVPSYVLLSGSYNTWTDGETFVRALEIASAEAPELEVEVTGGAVPEHSERGWARFVAAARASTVASRIRLHGWVSAERLHELESSAACGVVPESNLVERQLGSQNRTLRWLARGIPVVTTRISEVGQELERAGAARIYDAGDPVTLARALLAVTGDPALALQLRQNGLDWLQRERSIAATTNALVSWAGDPRAAADRRGQRVSERVSRHLEVLAHWGALQRERSSRNRGSAD